MLTSRSGKRDSVIQLASTACLPGGVRSGYIRLSPTTSFCRDVGTMLEVFQHIRPGRAPAQQGFRLLARCLLVQNQSIRGGAEFAPRFFQRPPPLFPGAPPAFCPPAPAPRLAAAATSATRKDGPLTPRSRVPGGAFSSARRYSSARSSTWTKGHRFSPVPT